MDKYVIYNSKDDTYLNCGHNIHHLRIQDAYVDDVNDATLFNTLDEIWDYLSDYEYTVVPIVLKVKLDVTPNHMVDYNAIRREAIVDEETKIIEGLSKGPDFNLTEEEMELFKRFYYNNKKSKPLEEHAKVHMNYEDKLEKIEDEMKRHQTMKEETRKKVLKKTPIETPPVVEEFDPYSSTFK